MIGGRSRAGCRRSISTHDEPVPPMILIRHGQSEFNVVYGRTRQDPGISDPALTAEGRRQAAAVADLLRQGPVKRLVASPYTRALETAEIIASALSIPVTVDPIVGERAAFVCDIGTCRSDLGRRWPDWRFDHLEEEWWPTLGETEAKLAARAQAFREFMAAQADWQEVAVVSHWGFIRALTGVELGNCQAVRFDPTASDPVQLLGCAID